MSTSNNSQKELGPFKSSGKPTTLRKAKGGKKKNNNFSSLS